MEPNAPVAYPGTPPTPAPATPAPCWRCGTPPEDHYQEYCLECGVRLARYYPRRSLFSRETWSGESPAGLWLALLAILVLALISTAIVAAASTRDDDGRRPRAAAPGPTTTPLDTIITDVTTFDVPTTAPPTTTPTFGTTTDTATTATSATTTTASTSGIISWPTGTTGYTIVLDSVPTSQGRSAANAKANEALDAGLSEVGVLNSSDYSSLRAGYYVVFTGVYDTEAQAENDLSSVRSSGYPTAYVREIAP